VSTIDEIVAAARKLTSSQRIRLRKKLEELELTEWDRELDKSTSEMKKKRITDAVIDRMIMRRRRESRR
jgi:hypothetical protein